MKDLNTLPRLSDSISYLYIERAVIEQEAASITAFRKGERIPIPVATIDALFLGPGTKITHAAVRTAVDADLVRRGRLSFLCIRYGRNAQRGQSAESGAKVHG